MTKVPEKCSRCGAPISWEEGAPVVKCEFCGYKNNLKNDFLNLKVNRDIQEKFSKIYLPAKKVIENKYSKVILLTSLVSILGLFLNKIINDPTRPYKVKIDEACKNISSNQSTTFNAKSTYKDCRKFFKKTIYSLDNIEKKVLDKEEFEKSKNKLTDDENGIWGNGIRYSTQTSQGYKRVYIFYETPSITIKKRNNLLTKNIKNDCKKVQSLYKALKDLIIQNQKDGARIEKLRKIKIDETGIDPVLISPAYSFYEITWSNWSQRIFDKLRTSYTPEENLVKEIISKNPTLINLDITFQRDRYNPPTKKQCVLDLTEKMIRPTE